MADVTVGELAKVVGVSVDRLLAQVKEAGLPHTSAEDPISNEDKNTLLLFLRQGHGGGGTDKGESSPRKVTLKRKSVGTLKSSSGQNRNKTVSVEVRKKRTYVKRSELEQQIREEQEETSAPSRDTEEHPSGTEEAAAQAQEQPTAGGQQQAESEQEQAQPEAGADEAPAADSEAADSAAAEKESKDSPVTSAPESVPTPPPSDKPSRGSRKASDRKRSDQDDDKKSARKKDKGSRKKGKGKVANEDFVLEDGEYEERGRGRRGGRRKSRLREHGFEKPTEFIVREVEISEANPVSDLAQKMSVKAAEVVKVLFKMGVMANINQVLDQDTATLLVEEMGHKPKFVSSDAIEEDLYEELAEERGEEAITRAPVVSVMGHVDHGKTSLLDYVRKSSVATGEAGGITQHIGAYHVNTNMGMVSFLDTPGHAAFSAMRSRGAEATDVVVLVVAADDGVKPQTEEAIQHARAAGVPIVVAITKVDKEGADIDKVINELATKEIIPESWGGDTQFVQVSAHTGQGIDELLEAILLQGELLELTAYLDVPSQGVVVESRLDKGRGPVATVLVQNGTLRVGDNVLVGHEYGRIRALIDEKGESVESAGPSIPVEILGLNGVPEAGDDYLVVADERKAREVAEFRRERQREKQIAMQQSNKIDSLFAGLGEEKAVFNVVLKADVRGSMEAIVSSLQNLNTDEVEVKVVGSGVGGISETDAHLAATSNARLIGFNVRADKAAREVIENEGLELRYYNVIYDVIEDVKAILGGMLEPEKREEILGVAEVRDVFNSPKYGQIAGCMVVEGTIYRNQPIRVLREDVVIYEGELESLRRFKEDVNEVRSGMECGIGVKNYRDVRVGDKIEVFKTVEVARTL